ncbi:MAG TPA: nuclear transport factor 2 family protein [Syntrophales bacterium]|nr:nuclear transport factor 2 family protein [Syntrophales bacterium]
MTELVPRAVLDAADISEITQLILRERLSRDLGLWEQMRACFHEDSRVRLSWIDASGHEFVHRSQEMASRNVCASHRLGPILVTLSRDRAIATLAGIIDIPLNLQGIDVILSSHARFLYRTERRSGRWGIAGFDAIYQRDEINTTLPGQAVAIDPNAVKGLRPSYRLLAYCIGAEGFPVRDDLAGADRPDLVATLNAEIYGWAGLTPPT